MTAATLSVSRFAAPDTADAVLPRLATLNADADTAVLDAALVTWPARHRKPSIRDLGSLTGPGALWNGFWGVLLALIFLTPLAGPRFGAAAGALAGSLTDFGVEDDFVKRVRELVTPGTSAIFLIGNPSSPDRIGSLLADVTVEMLRADLSEEQTRRLRDTLSDESNQVKETTP
jgi:uncharacterized membrane protein